ncbi:hypothetical protein MKW94_015610, partial [Papaver nudicaule]|nr:hypothetical protein [Papaver nudicaule]
IHVDMNTTCIQQVEPNKCQCSKCTIRDDENPLPESINCTKVEESSKVFFSSTDCKGIIMTYLTR